MIATEQRCGAHLQDRRIVIVLANELGRLFADRSFKPEWQPPLNDLYRFQLDSIEKDGKVGRAFQSASTAQPGNIAEIAA